MKLVILIFDVDMHVSIYARAPKGGHIFEVSSTVSAKSRYAWSQRLGGSRSLPSPFQRYGDNSSDHIIMNREISTNKLKGTITCPTWTTHSSEI